MAPVTVDPNAPFFIILNAASGHEETEVRQSTIEQVLRDAGRRFHLELVNDAAELAGIARHMVDRATAERGIVVAAGGDGTINTVATMAVASGCAFGVLPQGTFNYFGRTHGIPEDLADAARALVAARVHAVQIGKVNDRIFLVNASIGLYPRLLEERELYKRQYGRSRLVALWAALLTSLRPFHNIRITLELDGKLVALRTPTLFVGNNRLQMEQVGLPPLADALEDGRLAAITVHPTGALGMLGLLVRGALRRLQKADKVVHFSFRRLTIRPATLSARRRMKVAIDGEIVWLKVPLEFRVLEGQLNLLKPDAQSVSVAAASAAVVS